MKNAGQAEHEIGQDRSSESLELMPGIAKIECRLKCEVRGQKAARRNMLTHTENSEDEILQ
jgi:hypothetical protein